MSSLLLSFCFGKPHVATTGWIYRVIEYLFNKEHANKKQHVGQGKPITLFIGISKVFMFGFGVFLSIKCF